MSFFYSLGIMISTFIQKSFRNSKLFLLIFEVMLSIENCFLNSYFRSIYPNKNFLSFLKKSKILKNYLFHPLSFLIAFFIFILLSTINLSLELEITLLLAFFSFIFGAIILPRFFFKDRKKINFIEIRPIDLYSIGFICILIGILSFFVCAISMGGLTIFNPSLRYKLIPILTMPISLLIPGVGLVGVSYLKRFKDNELNLGQIRFRFLTLILIASFFLFALGYRTHICAVILMMFIIGYYGRIFCIWEVIIGIFLGFLFLLGFGYYRSLEENSVGSMGLFGSLRSRVDFTINVLNLLNSVSGDFGITHGRLTLSSIPGSSGFSTRMIIGKLIAWRSTVSITPTIIGPMLVDFGRIGVFLGMTLLGFILGLGYKIMKISKDSSYIFVYSLLLTYAVICIETGLMDINVMVYFLLGFLLFLANIFHNKKRLNIKEVFSNG